MTNSVPKEEGLDHSLSLLREGYLYILNRRQSFQSDVFETRLLGKKRSVWAGKKRRLFFTTTANLKERVSHQTEWLKPCLVKGCANIGWRCP